VNVPVACVALALLVGSWLVLFYARRQRRHTHLPAGRIVYADTGDWRPPDKPLFSAAHSLVGRPDYVVSTRDGVIPIEVKSGVTPAQPHASHIMQLAAYCLLVEETQGMAPRYGLVQYPDCTFRVPYTPTLRRELLGVLESMRSGLRQSEVPRSHSDARRCAACGYRAVCDERGGGSRNA
jgi:CRISPR-associated exonuclease Cas4